MDDILKGIKIVDFTRLLPGPLATNLLAQMGAEVIKVERPTRKDYLRDQPPFIDEESTLFAALNHNKDSRFYGFANYESHNDTIDLLEIVKTADVLIEQFRPGVMQAYRWGYDRLEPTNPKLIYISLSGYGQTGPYSQYAGHDINYLAYSGVLGMCRDEHGKPIVPGVQIADIAGGAYMTVSACLGALFKRSQTGKGQYIDVAMLDGLMPLMTFPFSQYWGGIDPRTVNVLSGGLVNYEVYECKDKKWIALGALEIKFWSNFCDLVERPDWKRQHQLELSNRIFPKKEIEAIFRTRSRDEWVELTEGKDICLSPVLEIDEVEKNPQIQHRNMIAKYYNKKGSLMRGIGNPIKWAKK